jgi:hypothetical protein
MYIHTSEDSEYTTWVMHAKGDFRYYDLTVLFVYVTIYGALLSLYLAVLHYRLTWDLKTEKPSTLGETSKSKRKLYKCKIAIQQIIIQMKKQELFWFVLTQRILMAWSAIKLKRGSWVYQKSTIALFPIQPSNSPISPRCHLHVSPPR